MSPRQRLDPEEPPEPRPDYITWPLVDGERRRPEPEHWPDPEDDPNPPAIHYPPPGTSAGLWQPMPPPPPIDIDAWRARWAALTPEETYQAAARYGQRIIDAYRPALDAMAATLGRMLSQYAEALARVDTPAALARLAQVLRDGGVTLSNPAPDQQGHEAEEE